MTNEIMAMMIDEGGNGAAVLDRVSADGAAVVPLASAWSTTPELLREGAAASPFSFVTRLLGVEPLLVERQPIRPVDGGRSFASTRVDTPLHTDSQMFLGMSATLQILVCVTPAARGGESLLVDGARLLARLERDEPTFANALFEVDRVQRFYFGDVAGPTVALRGGHLTWTCSPIGLPGGDGVASTLAQLLRSEQIIQHQLRPGDVLVASNHRMLHGRRAFEGDRELVRLLVWLERPLPAAPLHVARARELSPPADASTLMRLRAVLAILRGVPPAKVASDLRIPEATLYAWRDTFTRAGVQSLARARGA